jgi:hypothetical protein
MSGIARLPDDNFQLTISAGSNLVYDLQASTNLADWIDLMRYSNVPVSSVVYTDLFATNFRQRFYRSVWRP